MSSALKPISSLERALAYSGGSHTPADIEAAVERGELQRWDGEASSIITEIKQTPQQRLLLYFLAGGDMTELRAMSIGINEWGRSVGCVKAQIVGRLGWARSPLTREDGWRQTAVLLEKEL